MSNSTTNSVSFPLNSNDQRSLPELIAEQYGFALAFVDHEDGNRYYAVQDWIAGVAQVNEPAKYWHDIKRRFKKAGVETSVLCRSLPYRAHDGKTYKRDHADAAVLYQVTQRMDANTGLRNQILQFLAKAGVVLDEMRIDPEQAIDAAIEAYRRQGKSDAWIETRIQSKVARLYFTSAFRKSLRKNPSQWQYAIITDEMRLGLWKRSTAILKSQMGLKKNDNLRDHQSAIALAYETLAERISGYQLEQQQNLEFDESKTIVRKSSEFVGKQAEDAGHMLGIDVATNRPLLPDNT